MSEGKFNIFDDNHMYYVQDKVGAKIRLSSREEIDRYLLNPQNPIPDVNGYKTWLSNYVLTFWMPILKPNPFAVYIQLLKLAFGEKEYAYPTIGYLVDATGLSESTVKRSLKRLQDEDFVVVIHVTDTRRNTNTPNLFLLSRTVPFLTDKQLATLPERLQKEHAKFLDKIKYKKTLFNN